MSGCAVNLCVRVCVVGLPVVTMSQDIATQINRTLSQEHGIPLTTHGANMNYVLGNYFEALLFGSFIRLKKYIVYQHK
jgi:hypothetical protein